MFIAHTKIVSDLNKVSRKSRRHFKRNTFNGWACACNFLLWKSVFGTKCMKLPSTVFVEKARTVWQIHKNFGSGSIQCNLNVGLLGVLTPPKETMIYSWRPHYATPPNLAGNNQRLFTFFKFDLFTLGKICIHNFWKTLLSRFLFWRKEISYFHPCASVVKKLA